MKIECWIALTLFALCCGLTGQAQTLSQFASSPEVIYARDKDAPPHALEDKRSRSFYPGTEVKLQIPEIVKSITLLNSKGEVIPTFSVKAGRKPEKSGNKLTIPPTLSGGMYTLGVKTLSGETRTFQLLIRSEKASSEAVTSEAATLPSTPVQFRTQVCDTCQWEMSLAQNPINPNEVAIGTTSGYHWSKDGGRSWSQVALNESGFMPAGTSFIGDTVIAFDQTGTMYLAAMYLKEDPSRPTPNGPLQRIGGVLFKGKVGQALTASIFNSADYDTPNTQSNVTNGSMEFHVDYEKISVSPDGKDIVLSGNLALPPAPGSSLGSQGSHNALRVSRDYGVTWTTVFDDNFAYGYGTHHVQLDGVGGSFGALPFGELLKVKSLSGGTWTKTTAVKMDATTKRLYTGTQRYWSLFSGATQVLVDKSPSSRFRGRTYVLFAKPESTESSEDGWAFGKDYNVYAVYSDDYGVSWSTPVRISDDTNGSDQGVPYGDIDSSGVLYVAFVDQRQYPSEGKFEVAYSYSRNGGLSWSANQAISDKPFTITQGGRVVGDYLHTLGVSGNKVHVAFPSDEPTLPNTAPYAITFVELGAADPPTSNPPSINQGGVVNAADYSLNLEPGSIASLFGTNLTGGCTFKVSSLPVPTLACGTQVLIDDVPAQIFYASDSQVNFYVPKVGVGIHSVTVTRGSMKSNALSITLKDWGVAIYTTDFSGTGLGAFQEDPGYRPITQDTPTSLGKIIFGYTSGIGAGVATDVYLNDQKLPGAALEYFGGNSYLGQGQFNLHLPAVLTGLSPGTNTVKLKLCRASTTTCTKVVDLPVTR